MPPWVSHLPTVNAVLNAASAALLGAGYARIRRGDAASHRALMISAFACSCIFLASYVTYHAFAGSVPYHGPGRPAYLAILVSHTLLAALVPILTIRALYLAWRAWPDGDFARHRRVARLALPIWLYVSVTGVVVYWMLYVWPGAGNS